MREEDNLQQPPSPEDLMQELRLKANELLLREEWQESIQLYTQFINFCQDQTSNNPQLHLTKINKSLCLALSNRAEARFRLKDFKAALQDCDSALQIESTHFKSLICKGKILICLNRYLMALNYFKTALLDHKDSGNLEMVNGYVEKCKKLEFQSRTGVLDLSDWVLNGFRGKIPDLAEFIGPVEIRKSELSGRGLFATKNIDAGTLLLVNKAVAIERGILSSEDSSENAQLVMWKNFVDEVVKCTKRSKRIRFLVSTLSNGEEEDDTRVPEMSLFRPEGDEIEEANEELDMVKMMSILDVNALVEDSVSAKVLGKNSDFYGVGLWVVASFINHSCNPNARRLHVGDYILVHASRDVKAGEEITFPYFDVLSPLYKRMEMSKAWGFQCHCKRCKFEEQVCCKDEVKEIEIGVERGGLDVGGAIFRLEEGMKRWMVRGKEKGYLRASFWGAYSEAYGSEKTVKRWGRRLPGADVVADSVAEATGSDERIIKVLMKKSGNVVEMEKVMRLGKGVYGKVVKKQAMRSLLEL
ncbi:methyltransferase FGSG_00040 [Mercurialis annua]|uniref:methyltransferase FGSG_00040 n=1 Tax=Mercurialis annua TaxID=3986 RepID=UPI00215DDD9F|nr:methyltransferase FGSG_00040 [Mercurialis annua]